MAHRGRFHGSTSTTIDRSTLDLLQLQERHKRSGSQRIKISGAATRQRNWGHQGDRGRVPQPVDGDLNDFFSLFF